MRAEYVCLKVADRLSPEEWAEVGQPDLIARATERRQRILAQASAPSIDPTTDAAIRAAFRIHF
jgi:trimethylamine---corrinoid protein Co-methyltransferase